MNLESGAAKWSQIVGCFWSRFGCLFLVSGLCAELWSPIGFDSLLSLRLLPGFESFRLLVGQAALCILGFLMRVWQVYGMWLVEWNQKLFVYCCEMCSVQCYQAGDSVAHVHMYLASAVMLQAHHTAAHVSIFSLVSVVGETAEPVAK